jgi:glutathione S-transferase
LKVSDEQRLAWIQHWLGAGFQAIETLLAEHPSSGRFCHGEGPTIADIYLVTQVTPAMTFSLSLGPYPRVMRVYNTCMAIPALPMPTRQSSPTRSREAGIARALCSWSTAVKAPPLLGKRVLRGDTLGIVVREP